MRRGAAPVFIDTDRSTWNMDPGLLTKELQKQPSKGLLPKAVMLAHLWLKVPYLKAACIHDKKCYCLLECAIIYLWFLCIAGWREQRVRKYKRLNS